MALGLGYDRGLPRAEGDKMKDKQHSEGNPEYSVGYAMPPLETRFRRGRSGNPKGRRKGVKNLTTLLQEELRQQVSLTENGKRKKVVKLQALVKQLVNKALSNDPKAAALVLDQIRRSEATPTTPTMEVADDRKDALIANSIIRRIRLNDNPPAATGTEQEPCKTRA